MSLACANYLLYEIKKVFGTDVEAICQSMLLNEWMSWKELKACVKHLKEQKVLEYVQLLIDHNFITCIYDGKEIDAYQFDIVEALSFINAARYLELFERHYGNASRNVCELLCKYGNLYTFQIVQYLQEGNSKMKFDDVVSTVSDLVNAGLLEITPFYANKFKLSAKDVHPDKDKLKNQLSKRKQSAVGDKRIMDNALEELRSVDVQYRINIKRANILMRNEIVSRDAAITLGEKAGFVLKKLLGYYDIETRNDAMRMAFILRTILEERQDFTEPQLKDCIYQLSTDFYVPYLSVSKDSELRITIDVHRILRQIVIKTLSELVRTVFGKPGLRVFNYLLYHPFTIDNKLLNELKISEAELTTLLRTMHARGIVSMQETPHGDQWRPQPGVYFTDLSRAIRSELQTCYQSLYRLAVRRSIEQSRPHALLTKMMKQVDEDPVEEETIPAVTDRDRDDLKKLCLMLNRLDASEEAIQTTLFLFEQFLEVFPKDHCSI